MVGHKAAGDLGESLCWQNGFDPIALPSTPDAVQLKRRPRPQAFAGGIARLAKDIRHAQIGDIGRLVKGHAGYGGAVFDRQIHHIVVKARHRDLAIQPLHRGDQMRQAVDRVGNAATLLARMLITLGTRHGDFCRNQPLSPRDQIGLIFAPLAAIGGKDHIGFEQGAIGRDKGRQVRRAYFLLAFKEEFHIDRQTA